MSCFFGVSCSCGVVALHSNHSQWYFGSTKLEEIFLESPWTLGGTQKVLTSSLPWLLVGRPGQIYKKGLFSFPMLAEAKIWTPNGWTNIFKKRGKADKFCHFNVSAVFHICICSPGVLQGVRLSRKFSNRSVLQPQVVDEVVKIVAHPHLCSSCSRSCANQVS